jgi:hypothetical protein
MLLKKHERVGITSNLKHEIMKKILAKGLQICTYNKNENDYISLYNELTII